MVAVVVLGSWFSIYVGLLGAGSRAARERLDRFIAHPEADMFAEIYEFWQFPTELLAATRKASVAFAALEYAVTHGGKFPATIEETGLRGDAIIDPWSEMLEPLGYRAEGDVIVVWSVGGRWLGALAVPETMDLRELVLSQKYYWLATPKALEILTQETEKAEDNRSR